MGRRTRHERRFACDRHFRHPSIDSWHGIGSQGDCPAAETSLELHGEKEREAPEGRVTVRRESIPSTTWPPLHAPDLTNRIPLCNRNRREDASMRLKFAQAPPAIVEEDWKQAWRDSYPCDMPSTVPYPHVPLSACWSGPARPLSRPPGVYALQQGPQLPGAQRPGRCGWPGHWRTWVPARGALSACCCRTFPNTWLRCRRPG